MKAFFYLLASPIFISTDFLRSYDLMLQKIIPLRNYKKAGSISDYQSRLVCIKEKWNKTNTQYITVWDRISQDQYITEFSLFWWDSHWNLQNSMEVVDSPFFLKYKKVQIENLRSLIAVNVLLYL